MCKKFSRNTNRRARMHAHQLLMFKRAKMALMQYTNSEGTGQPVRAHSLQCLLCMPSYSLAFTIRRADSGDSTRIYSRLSLSRTPRDSLNYFEISVVRHIRFAELRKK